MPLAGFGWSAGDIAKAIELLATIYKGLQETGGAASGYQQTTNLLKGLILTLQHLETLHLTCTDPRDKRHSDAHKSRARSYLRIY
jgi:hypothetical protein